MLSDFAARHGLGLGAVVEREKLAIHAAVMANASVTAAYSKLSDAELSDPAVGLLLNMLHRSCELAEAAIVAFVTGSGSASEVVSRACVESSANIAFILAGNTTGRLLAYFDHYFRSVDRQVKAWRKESSALSGADAQIHDASAARRQKANDTLRDFVNQAFGTQHLEQWPSSIEKRFSELGQGLAYRTFYARMSSEAHGDAEETIRYFVGRLQSQEVFEAMALETVWNSRLFLYYAVASFLDASLLYCRRYSLSKAGADIARLRADVEIEPR
ncbi:DUF5677 domain-containing protein [Bradyrhizobium guangxiense]